MTYDGLTTEDVNTKRFTPVRGGREGYDMEEVDLFLDEVERSLGLLNDDHTILVNDLNSSTEQLAIANARLAELESENARLAQELQDTKIKANEVIDEANAQIEEIIAQSNAESERVKQEAAEEIERVKREAEAARLDYSAPVATAAEIVEAEEELDLPEVDDSSEVAPPPVVNAEPQIQVIKVETTEDASFATAKLVELAEQTAEATRLKAEEEAAQLVSEATALKENAEQEVNEYKESELSRIEEERATLEEGLVSLRELEASTRNELKTYLSELQEKVNEPLSSDKN